MDLATLDLRINIMRCKIILNITIQNLKTRYNKIQTIQWLIIDEWLISKPGTFTCLVIGKHLSQNIIENFAEP